MDIIQLTSNYVRAGKGKSYDRTYNFHDANGEIRWSCDVYGECNSAPTEYVSFDDEDKKFVMKPKGKLLNSSYFLEDSAGDRFATITRKGVGFRWKMLGIHDEEITRIVDPSSSGEAFLRELFTALPDSYAVVSEDFLIAKICKEKLLETIPKKKRNVLGKYLEKVFEPRGLTLTFENDTKNAIDPRVLVAAMTLLQVRDITGVNRQ